MSWQDSIKGREEEFWKAAFLKALPLRAKNASNVARAAEAVEEAGWIADEALKCYRQLHDYLSFEEES